MRVVYLHGFASSPGSTKAQFFRQRFAERGIECEIPQLDGGDFRGLTLSGQLSVVERTVGAGPVVLMGSSMGGYLAALYAARHAEQIECVIALAPAFDFAARWRLRMGEEAMEKWEQAGKLEIYHYGEKREAELSYTLYTDSLLYEAYPEVARPMLILHGSSDDVVPISLSEQYIQRNRRARIVRVETGHEMTDRMELLWAETAGFLNL
jgi:pimeloyl-ACP methyl ester carboxylesterase